MLTSDDTTAWMIGFGRPYEVATYITTIHIPNFKNVSIIILLKWEGTRVKRG